MSARRRLADGADGRLQATPRSPTLWIGDRHESFARWTGELMRITSATSGSADFLASGNGALIVFGSLALAAVLVLLRWVTVPGGYRLADELAEVNYSPSTSWASSLTGLASILGTLVGTSGIIADTATPLPGPALTGLNLLFGVILLIAPLLFTTFSRLDPPDPASVAPAYRGYVGAFLGTVLLTLWATFGALATSTVLLSELASGYLTEVLQWLFIVLLVAGAALIVGYSWRSVADVITYRSAPGAGGGKTRSLVFASSRLAQRQTELAVSPRLTATAGRQPSPQPWHLL